MPIAVSCKSCSAAFKAPDTAAGKRAKCPKCGQPIAIPAAGRSAAAAQPKAPAPPAPKPQPKPAPVAIASPVEQFTPTPETPAKSKRTIAGIAIGVVSIARPAARRTLSIFKRRASLPAKAERGDYIDAEFRPVANARATSVTTRPTKDCPFCGEEILAVAKKCKHCGETLDVVLRASQEAVREAEMLAIQRSASPAYAPDVNVHVDNRRHESQKIVVKGGGGAGSVFMGLFLFFIVMPIVATVGCFACLGTVAHQAANMPRTSAPVALPPAPDGEPSPTAAESIPAATEPSALEAVGPRDAANMSPIASETNSVDTEPPAEAPDSNTKTRIWHDMRGHETKAEFGGVVDGVVILKKTDGKTVKVPVSKLSDEDREWLEQRKHKAR